MDTHVLISQTSSPLFETRLPAHHCARRRIQASLLSRGCMAFMVIQNLRDGHVSISVERFHLRGNDWIVLDVGSDSAKVDWTYCCKLESRRIGRGNLECHRVLDEES